MAEEQDSQEKTEEPTQRKIDKSILKYLQYRRGS